MKVIHISTSDSVGGAARAALRLHQGLSRLDPARVQSEMLVADRCLDDPSVRQYRPLAGAARKARRAWRRWRENARLSAALRNRPQGFEPFSLDRSAHGEDLTHRLGDCDIVNLHWVSGLLDYGAFLSDVRRRCRVVWTLHDMNPFTGGCHYDAGCGRFKRGCGACPQLGSRSRDLSSEVWRRKKSIFERIPSSRLHLVAPSRWMHTEANASPVLNRFDSSIIPNGLDLRSFAPIDRESCRTALGISAQSRVVLFVAQSSQIRRKGFSILAAALRLCQTPKLFLLSVGGGRPNIGDGLPHLHLGAIEEDRLLAIANGAADIFVIPSIQDNLPNTVMEAMACATPVVGFDVGGIPEMVRAGQTGILAPVGDAAALAKAIDELLGDELTRAEMSRHCRGVAEAEYDIRVAAERYAQLYEQLLGAAVDGADLLSTSAVSAQSLHA